MVTENSLNRKVSVLKKRERLNTIVSYYIDMLSSNDVASQLQLENEQQITEEELLQSVLKGELINQETFVFIK